MSEFARASAAFSVKTEAGLKNIRFFVLPGREVTAEMLATDVNRMDDSIAVGLCRLVEDPDEGLPKATDIGSIVAQLEANRHRK